MTATLLHMHLLGTTYDYNLLMAYYSSHPTSLFSVKEDIKLDAWCWFHHLLIWVTLCFTPACRKIHRESVLSRALWSLYFRAALTSTPTHSAPDPQTPLRCCTWPLGVPIVLIQQKITSPRKNFFKNPEKSWIAFSPINFMSRAGFLLFLVLLGQNRK